MNKSKRSKAAILTAAALSAALSMQTAVFASPAEELQEIMEDQFEDASPSLLEKTIGFSRLWEKMEEKGFSLNLEGNLTQGTAELLEIQEAIPEGSSFQMGMQLDPKLKKWLFQLGLNRESDSMIDLSLYGDREQLALTLPQFFSGALGIRSGSFKEQYEGSSLQRMLEGEEPSTVSDFDLKFYPEDKKNSREPNLFDLNDRIEDRAEEFQDQIQAQKAEEDGRMVYTVIYKTQDIIDFYRFIMEEYLNVFENSGLMVNMDNQADSTQEEIDQMLDLMSCVMGDEVEVHFTVRNDLVEKISYELYIDSQRLAQSLPDTGTEGETEMESETDSQSLISVDVSVEDEEFQGYMDYEIIFANPERPWQEFDFCMTVEDLDRNEMSAFYLEKVTEETATSAQTKVRVELSQEGETLYSDTPVEMTFDASTGDLNAVLKIADPDEENTVILNLSSTFSDVEKGSSFLWTVNELSLESDGEKAGLQGSLRLAAKPQPFEAPQEERMVLELNDSELMSLLSEVMINGQTWAAQFQPETESVDDTSDSDNALASIMGSSDGPTSIFVAGKI